MPRAKAEPKNTPQSYEELMQRLHQVVERLEAGELPLADAVTLYEEGVALSTRCQELLATAELRVQQVVVGHDGVELAPWNDG